MVGVIGSFESWFIDRNAASPIEFEGVFQANWVRDHVTEAVSVGYKAERLDGFARVVYEWHDDGRPWVYSEYYPIETVEVTV